MREAIRRSRELLVLALGAAALLLGAACTAAEAAPTIGTDAQARLARPTRVDVVVTATEFGFKAAQTTFQVGVPYRFIVTNKGAIPHEAMLMPVLASPEHEAGTAPGSAPHRETPDGALTGMQPGEMHEDEHQEMSAEMAAHEEESTGEHGAMPGGHEGGHEELHAVTLGLLEAKDLPPTATGSFEVTFTEPAAEGTLELACRLPGHYEAGMHIPIVVTP